MYEIVKYNNFLNSVSLKNFTSAELDFFTTICSKIKEKELEEVVLTFDEIKKLSKYKSKDKSRFVKDLIEMNKKLMQSLIMNIKFPNGAICTFSLFSYFKTNPNDETLKVKINEDWYFVFNELTNNFTQFELNEFVTLKNKYAKIFFRIFKQYKTTGMFVCEIEQLKKYLDVPKSYSNMHIMEKIIKPAMKDLKPYFKNLKVTPLYKKERGKPLQGYKFTFRKTIIKAIENEKQEVEQTQKKTRKKNKFNDFTQSNYSDRFYDLLEIKMGRGLTQEEKEEYEEELKKARR